MVGKSLGHYEVLEPLGTGAMGEVYRALDTNLKRDVAIKVLSAELAEDPDRLARLEREAQLLAAVNHPNIAAIYSLEETAGTRFLVLELIEGESLADTLDTTLSGAMPIDEALELCGQVAKALEAAHGAGIAHRDLKPANIMVTSDGRAKVLDFGIAKTVEASAESMETAKHTELTGTGMIVGTAPYMSPEQVRAQSLDKRSDIWAFGCVLYETLAGKRAFGRETVGDTLSAILEHEPEWRALPADTPLEVESLLRRCLQKDRQSRLQDIGDAWVEINEVLATSPGARLTTAGGGDVRSHSSIGRGKLAVGAMSALAIVAAVVFGVVMLTGRTATAPMVASTHQQITFAGDATDAAISPDGLSVLYVTGNRGESQRLMLADLAGGPAIEILDGKSIINPEWSPDGSRLTVSAQRDLPTPLRVYLLRRLGGSPRRLGSGGYSTWSPDGSRVAFSLQAPAGISIFTEDTGETDFVALDGYDFNYGLAWSPKGDKIAVLAESGASGDLEIVTVDPDGDNQRTVIVLKDRLSSPRWAPDGGAIYFLRHTGGLADVLKVAVGSTGDPVDGPTVVLSGLRPGDSFNLSADGHALAYSTGAEYSNLWLAELGAEGSGVAPSLRQLTTGTSLIKGPTFSPDGQSIAYAARTSTGANIFTIPAAGGDPVQLTFSEDDQTGPAWSPDGRSIVFSTRDADGVSVWVVGSDGTQPRRFHQTEVSSDAPKIIWSPGRRVLFENPGNRNFSLLDPETGEQQALVVDGDRGFVFSAEYSPDGTQVALFWNRPPDSGLWLVTLEPYAERFMSAAAADPIGWSPDGAWVYAVTLRGDFVGRVPTAGGDLEVVFRVPGGVYPGSVDPSGTRIVVPVGVIQSDVFLVEDFDPTLRR